MLWAPIALIFVCFVYAIVISWRWPIVGDASIMHYVAFLMDHGMAPYRDIIDINMPGAFTTEWLAIHLLGPGNLAWRIFDILEMLCAIGACCVIAAQWDWRAGLLGGMTLSLAHIANGAFEAGQRDWTIAVLLLLGYAFLFVALRRGEPRWMGFFAFACSAAATIKPLAAPVPLALLIFACVEVARKRGLVWRFIGWSTAGALVAVAGFFGFLAAFRATASFFKMVSGLLVFYTAIGNASYSLMARLVLGRYLTALLIGALLLAGYRKQWRERGHLLLLSGMFFGVILYFGQHKGYGQHRLTLLSFVLLYLCVQAYESLGRGWKLRSAGAAMLLLLLVYTISHWAMGIRRESFNLSMQVALERDLTQLGGPALSGKVQCLEMASGCIAELYHMRLMQPTGFISDFFLFSQHPEPAMQTLRDRLMSEMIPRPPQVIVVVASNWAGGRLAYQPTENWPQFADWLNQHYRLTADHLNFIGETERGSYRIYTLR